MEDCAIVELYWNRDTRAIEQTNIKYGPYCYSIANNVLHNREDAEECVNDTWFKAWNAIPPQKPAILQMFLAKITRNLALNRYEARSAQKRGGGEICLVLDELAECIPGGPDVAESYEHKQLGESVRRFVRTLPEREGDVLVRRYFFTEPICQIARRYGITENYTAVILNRVRKKLKEYLAKEGFISGQD